MSAEVLEVGWLRVTLVEVTSASERARAAAQRLDLNSHGDFQVGMYVERLCACALRRVLS